MMHRDPRLAAVCVAAVFTAACGSSVSYSTHGVGTPISHRKSVAVADIIDGRGYSTPLLDEHELGHDLDELRSSVREHVSALGLEHIAVDGADAAALTHALAVAAARNLDALILLRVRATSYGGFYAGIHRAAGTMGSLFFLGLVPAIIAIILDSVPASEQHGRSVVEAYAVQPRTSTILARAVVVGRADEKVTAFGYAPGDALGPALRDACGQALRRVVGAVDAAPDASAERFDVERFATGQKLRSAADAPAAQPL